MRGRVNKAGTGCFVGLVCVTGRGRCRVAARVMDMSAAKSRFTKRSLARCRRDALVCLTDMHLTEWVAWTDAGSCLDLPCCGFFVRRIFRNLLIFPRYQTRACIRFAPHGTHLVLDTRRQEATSVGRWHRRLFMNLLNARRDQTSGQLLAVLGAAS